MVHSYTLSSSSYIIIDIYNTCFYPDHRVLKTNKIYRDLFSLLPVSYTHLRAHET